MLKWPRTEDEPCLAELQVDAEVGVEADVRDGDISARLPTQAPVLPETVPDTYRAHTTTERHQTCLPLLGWLNCSGDCERGGGGQALTVANSSDDPEDEEPEEHVGGVAQQQDEEQADQHGYHQSTAAAQTHHWLSGRKEDFSSSAEWSSEQEDLQQHSRSELKSGRSHAYTRIQSQELA